MKKRPSSPLKSDLKVKTTFSLNKTKPAKERRLQKIQKSLSQNTITFQSFSPICGDISMKIKISFWITETA